MLGGLFSLLCECLVLLSDLVELGHVFLEVGASLEGDEQLCLLGFTSVSIHGDGLGLDLLECSVVVSVRELG